MSRRGRGDDDSKSKTTKLKQLLIFAIQYLTALQDNLTSCFNCRTITLGSLGYFKTLGTPLLYLLVYPYFAIFGQVFLSMYNISFINSEF